MIGAGPRLAQILDIPEVVTFGDRLPTVAAAGHVTPLAPNREDSGVALLTLGDLATLGAQVGGDRGVQLIHAEADPPLSDPQRVDRGNVAPRRRGAPR